MKLFDWFKKLFRKNDKQKPIEERSELQLMHEKLKISEITKKRIFNYSSGTYGVLNLKEWDKKKRIKHK